MCDSPRSKVWTYFKRTPSGQNVICGVCQKIFKFCNNTTNMMEHLRRKHPEKIIELTAPGQQEQDDISSLRETHQDRVTYANNSTRKKHLDKLFTLMVAEDMEPLRMSEHEGLKTFVAALDSKYQLPSRTTLTKKLLPELHSQYKAQLAEVLTQVTNIAITFDMWTSVSNMGIGALTAHFIYKDSLVSALLTAKSIEGHHDADNLTAAVKETLEEWHIENKIVCMVTDHAAVMIKVASNLKYRHLGCCAHALNSIMQDTQRIPEFKELIVKCKNIVTFFRRSVLASDKLKAEQRRRNKKELKLIQESETRWNSTLDMITRIHEVRDELSVVISQCQNAPENLKAEEYDVIGEIQKILEPIQTCTEAISGDQYATISLIIPLIKGVSLQLCQLENQNFSELSKTVLNSVKSSVVQRLKPYEKRGPCIIATLLNPHFKKHGFKTDSDAEMAVSCVQQEYTAYLSTHYREPSAVEVDSSELSNNSSKRSKLSNLLSFLNSPTLVQPTNATSDAIVDVRQYIEKPNIPQDEDPILYWRSSQSQLKEIALKYFCIPGTSTPAERLFSLAGQIVTERRSRLSADHIDALLFIKQNHNIFKN